MTGPIERVAVVGAGTMGRQISLQVARSGIPVALFDADPAALGRARAAQRDVVRAWAAAGEVGPGEDAAIFERLRYVDDLGAAVRDADLAIEVVPERVELKRRVFAQLDEHCRDGAIIATNMHFYIPVWDHPMVEVGGGTRTSPETLEALTAFARRIGLLPLRVRKESTGFIFNRVWRAIKKETLTVVNSGVASHEDVDRAWMVMFETPYGPFGLMDQIGLDVVKDIEEHYAAESGDPSDLPPPVLTERVARGDLGQKTGRGFYTYPDPAYAAPDFLAPGDAGG